MKTAIRSLALLLSLVLLIGLCACGSSEPAAPVATVEPAPAPVVAGEYSIFGVLFREHIIDAAVLEASSVLELSEDGTGALRIEETTTPIEWELTGEDLVIRSAADSMTGTLADGVIVLHMGESQVYYYALPDADLSAYTLLDRQEMIKLFVESTLGREDLPDPASLVPEGADVSDIEAGSPEDNPAQQQNP